MLIVSRCPITFPGSSPFGSSLHLVFSSMFCGPLAPACAVPFFAFDDYRGPRPNDNLDSPSMSLLHLLCSHLPCFLSRTVLPSSLPGFLAVACTFLRTPKAVCPVRLLLSPTKALDRMFLMMIRKAVSDFSPASGAGASGLRPLLQFSLLSCHRRLHHRQHSWCPTGRSHRTSTLRTGHPPRPPQGPQFDHIRLPWFG